MSCILMRPTEKNKTKNLIMVFIYLPARLIAPALVPLIALADALKILHLSTVGGNGAGQGIHITLCPNASFHPTTSGLVCSGCWQICYSKKQTNKKIHWEQSLHVKLRKSITGKKCLLKHHTYTMFVFMRRECAVRMQTSDSVLSTVRPCSIRL